MVAQQAPLASISASVTLTQGLFSNLAAVITNYYKSFKDFLAHLEQTCSGLYGGSHPTRRRALRRRLVNRRVASGSQVLGPPSFSPTLIYEHRFRYIATSTLIATNVAWTSLVATYGMASTVNNVTSPVAAVRIKRVSVTAPAVATGSTCMLQWAPNSGVSSDCKTFSDTSINAAECASVVAYPPSNSDSSFWHRNTDSDVAFMVWGPQGSILDITLMVHLIDDLTVPYSLTGFSGLSVGYIYFPCLGGHSSPLSPVVPGNIAT